MQTTNNQTRKNKSVETILLIILFAIGALGFLYTFNNSKANRGENIVVTEQSEPISTIEDASNVY